MKKNIIGLLILTIFIFFGCGGGGGSSSSSGDDVSEGPTNNVSNENNQALSGPENVTVTPLGISRKATTATPYNTGNEISWDSVPGAFSYNIYWSNSTPFDIADIVDVYLIEDVTSPYIHSSLDSTETYYYKITSIDDTGESLPSDEASSSPLAAPTTVVTTAGNESIAINWDIVTGASSYNIYWLNTAGVTTGTGTLITDTITTNSYTHTEVSPGISLTNNREYFYIITAVEGTGEGSASDEVSAIPAAPLPSAPAISDITSGTTSNAITWTAPAESTGTISYNLYWLYTTGVSAGNGNVETNVTSPYTHSPLTNGLDYYYIVTAIDDNGEGPDSGEVTARPIAPPANVTATAGDTSNTITWAAMADATSFNIYWNATGSVTTGDTQIADTITTNSYTHSGLTNGDPYYYIVTAVKAAGASSASSEVSSTPVPPPAAPATVGATAGNTVNVITWGTVAGATSYNIYWDTTGTVTIGDAKLASVTSPYMHSSRTNGTEYFYIVTAENGSGESVVSAERSATPVVPLPAVPGNVTATPGNTENIISWNTVDGASEYYVYWGSATGITKNTGTRTTTDPITTNPYTHSGLTNGDPYYYIVTAVNTAGQSSDSSEVSVTPIAPPASVVATAGDSSNSITWDPVTGAASYNIYWNTTGSVTTGDTKIALATSGDTHSGLTNGSEYFYIVTVVNGNGEEFASTQVSSTPVIPVPSAPANTAAVAGNTSNVITWDPVAGATSYNIYWSETASVAITDTKIPVVTSPYKHSGRTNTTEYFYIVTAENSSGESVISSEVSATPAESIIPVNVIATAGNASNTVTWDAVTGAVSYNVSWNIGGVVQNDNLTSAGTNSFVHSSPPLTNGSAYSYLVTAVDGAAAESAPSVVASATPIDIPAAPVISSVSPGNTVNTVTWGVVAGATSYNLYWNTTGSVAIGENPTLGVTSPYMHSNLTNGTLHYYIVTAVNSSGESVASTQESETPIAPVPEAPANVKAVPGDASNIITWDTVDGATEYYVYWSIASGLTKNTGTRTTTDPITTNSYTHSGLTNGNPYYYIVTAVNATDQSPDSSEVSTTPITPPLITVIAGSSSNIITWSAVAAAESYNIYWLNTTGVTKGTGNVDSVSNVESSYTHSNITNNLTYYYILTAVNSGAEFASPEVSATPIAQPTNVTVTPGDTSNSVTWDTVTGAESYNVSWNIGSVTQNDNLTSAGTNSFVHSSPPLINGSAYYYLVTAVNTTGESSASTIVSATPVGLAAVPAISVTSGSTYNEITWTNNPNATSYNIYWNTTGSVAIGENPIIGVTSPYIHSALTNGTPYHYILTAVNGTGESAASAPVTATPEVPVPSVPAHLTATPGDTQNILIWDAVTGATSYNIYWGTATGVTTGTGTLIADIATNSHIHTGLTNGIEYFYIVTANNVTGEGLASAEASAMPIIPIPTKPVNVTATPGNTNNTIIWDESESATSYNIYWKEAAGSVTTGDNPILGITSPYIHTGLTPGTEYYYIVTAVNATGESSTSDEVSAIVLFPRPVTDTGQTTCYDNLEELADCPTDDPVLEAFYGQDGNYPINPQSYTKLDSDGNVLPFSATSWAMVRDTKTGLTWEVKTDDDGTQDKDYTYTWADAVTFVGDLNTVSFGRFTDWRLPTVKELQSIVDYSRSAPSINDVYFLNIISSPKDAHYWSSTEYAINTDTVDDTDVDTDHAWFVHFVNGYTDLSHKTMEHNVRAVRGGP